MAKNTVRFVSCLMACVVCFVFVLTTPAPAAKDMNLSLELRKLIGQAESTYFSKFGKTANETVNANPMSFASILGLTLQRQGNYSDQYPQYNDHYWVLRKQCNELIARLAKMHKYKDPETGSPMSAQKLQGEFLIGLQGKANAFFIQRFGINPATVNTPMILAQVPVPKDQQTVTPSYKLPPRDNGIVLGGEAAPTARSSSIITPYGGQTLAPTPEPRQSLSPNFPGSKVYNVKGRICPVVQPAGASTGYKIDTNNNPNDGTYVSCSYDAKVQGYKVLSAQSLYGEARRTGVQLRFMQVESGRIYLEFISERANGVTMKRIEYFDNGNMKEAEVIQNGKKVRVKYFPNGRMQSTYVNGNLAGMGCEDGSRPDGYGGCR